MRFWKSDDPRLKKENRILGATVIALIAAYVLVALLLAALTRDNFIGGWVVLGLMGLVALIYVPLLLATAQFIRWRLTVRRGADVPDRRLDQALTVTAFASGMTALAIWALTALWDIDFSYPWDSVMISSQAQHFLGAALSVSLGAMLLNYVLQWLVRRDEKKQDDAKRSATVRRARVAASVFLTLILLGSLLIPYEHGVYNDGGGSRYCKAALYEVIDWNRAPAEGAMAVPDDFDPDGEQRTRIYIFPFNCYGYGAKWDMKH